VLANVRAQVAVREALVPLAEVRRRALAHPAPRGGLEALCDERVAVIAEFDSVDPAHCGTVAEWEECGVAAVAVAAGDGVAAQQPWREMTQVRSRTQAPVLCLDLVVSSYQLWEARAHGAELVLLSAAALQVEALVSLVERADSIGLTPVIDVRDGQDLVLALRACARAVLVRAPGHCAADDVRATIGDLLQLVPDGVLRVAECGPAGRSDLIAYARRGADAVLLGQALLTGGDPRATIRDLVSMGAHPALGPRREQRV
jgi:indole-3-glycerol phosphate synthase